MSVTPNFSWPLIEPTDFVTNLPADLETLADDIDADVWAIKGTADAALPETLIDAAGDLIYGSAADTAARLAIGTAGQVLTVNAGATAPEWATAASGGGYTQIATGTLSSTGVSITSIPGTYRHLELVVFNPYTSTINSYLQVRINGVSGASDYNCGAINFTTGDTSRIRWSGSSNNLTTSSTNRQQFICTFKNYATTNGSKMGEILAGIIASQGVGTIGYWEEKTQDTTAITQIDIGNGDATNFGGGTYILYGIN